MNYPEFEIVKSDDFWKLSICPKCGCLLYKYQTKEGKMTCVSVLDGFQYHRYGNHNNYVTPHECGADARQGRAKKMYVNTIEVSEEVKEKVKGSLQQQAVMKALTEFSKPRIRSAFKKSMLEQAQKFLRGETQYKNTFSPKQVIAILGDSITSEMKMYDPKEFKNIEIKKIAPKFNHIMRFKGDYTLTVDDRRLSGYSYHYLDDKKTKTHRFSREYLNAREEFLESLYNPEMNFSITCDGNNIIYTEA